MSKRNRQYFVRCVESFDFIIPASMLEIRSIANSHYPDARIETPERVTRYTAGQIVQLSSARHVKDFCKAHGDKFEPVTE